MAEGEAKARAELCIDVCAPRANCRLYPFVL